MHSHNPVRVFAENKLIVPLLSACAALVIRMRRPLVIAVTGSVGKTTTKETIAGVLAHPASRATLGRLRKTPGNMNTNLGTALVVLGYEDWFSGVLDWVTQLLLLPFRTLALATVAPYPDVLVLEIAAGSVSNVPRNCRIVRPRIGALTEIGPAHLDYFGTIENIVRAKGALVRAIPPSGLVVLNRSNPVVAGGGRITRTGRRGAGTRDRAGAEYCSRDRPSSRCAGYGDRGRTARSRTGAGQAR